MASVSYITVGSNDLEAAKGFYDALLGSIGMRGVFEHPSGGRVYRGEDGCLFGVLGPYDGGVASVGNGMMGGFSFCRRDEVAAFHAKALELGGTCDGPPGERLGGSWLAYFRDLDGNKLCGFTFARV